MNSEAMSNFQYFFNKETKMSFSTSWLILFVITGIKRNMIFQNCIYVLNLQERHAVFGCRGIIHPTWKINEGWCYPLGVQHISTFPPPPLPQDGVQIPLIYPFNIQPRGLSRKKLKPHGKTLCTPLIYNRPYLSSVPGKLEEWIFWSSRECGPVHPPGRKISGCPRVRRS